MNLERELKLVVPPTFRMPEMDGIVPGVRAAPQEPRFLEATYFDTADLRLARWGASLRHRGGQGWTVKLAAGGTGDVLLREEHPFPGDDPAAPPPPAVELVRAFSRTAPLIPIAHVGTLRTPTLLQLPDGTVVAEVVDDDVTVRSDGVVSGRFREVEVELDGGCPEDLARAVETRLRSAGAGVAAALAKHLRALGYSASPDREIDVPTLPKDPSAGDVVRRAIAGAVERLILHDAMVRLDTDPEGVHQARVSTRRLRSDLRTFGPLLDPAWTKTTREELRWLGDVLGGARDTDVLLDRLRARVEGLPEAEQAGGAVIVDALTLSDKEAHAAVLDALRSDRYAALLENLVAAALAPPLTAAAQERAAIAMPALARGPARALAKAVRRAGNDPTDAVLHDIRIRAKRARYAAEAVAPAVGRQATRYAEVAAELQGLLGEHQDAVVAAAWLRTWAAGSASPDAAFAAGSIAGLERADAVELRRGWRKVWRRLDDPKLRRWM
jgi:CHAD domain-containing protein